MAVYNPFDFFLEADATHFPFPYEPSLRKELAPFLEPGALTPRLAGCLADVRREILGHPEQLAHAAAPDSLQRADPHHGGRRLPLRRPAPAQARGSRLP